MSNIQQTPVSNAIKNKSSVHVQNAKHYFGKSIVLHFTTSLNFTSYPPSTILEQNKYVSFWKINHAIYSRKRR